MAENYEDREFQSLFDKYMSVSDMSPAFAKELERQVLAEVARTIKPEHASAARRTHWLGQLLDWRPRWSLGYSLTMATAAVAAVVLLFIYFPTIRVLLGNLSSNTPETASPGNVETAIAIVTETATVTPTDTPVPADTPTPTDAPTSAPTATPLPTDTAEITTTETSVNEADAISETDTITEDTDATPLLVPASTDTPIAEPTTNQTQTELTAPGAREETSPIRVTSTATATARATSPLATPTVTSTPTRTVLGASPTATATATATRRPTQTPLSRAQPTPTATATVRSVLDDSPPIGAQPTSTSVATATPTKTATSVTNPPTRTATATRPTATRTSSPTATSQPTTTSTPIRRITVTSTPTPRPSATATITVTLTPTTNRAPIAEDDRIETAEDQSVEIRVLANDRDLDGDTLRIDVAGQASNGTARKNNGTITYTPRSNFNGTDAFVYTIRDSKGLIDTASVLVVVTPVNDAPVTNPDAVTTNEDASVTIDVLANDSDVDEDVLRITTISPPANGTITRDGDSVVYRPNTNFNGSDAFVYTVTDGRATDVAGVTIRVNPVNDAPIAFSDQIRIGEDAGETTISVLDNDRDPDDDALTIVDVRPAANGTVTRSGSQLTYKPNANFHGVEEVHYTISDGALSAEAVVTITVESVDDLPIIVNDTAATVEDTAKTIKVLDNDSDPDGGVLTVTSIGQPANGSVVNNGNSITYIPNPDFFGNDSFDYTVSNEKQLANTGKVNVQITGVPDLPEANDDSITITEDTTTTVNVLTNDNDVDGDQLTIVAVGQAQNGKATHDGANVIYTPKANYSGRDEIEYTVSDGSGNSKAKLFVTITAVQDPPNAVDDSAGTPEDTAVTIDVLANDSDPDGDSLTITQVTSPAHGATSREGNRIVYTPASNYSGSDEFRYTVSDGRFDKEAIVRIDVAPVNDPPLAQGDTVSIDEDVAVSIQVLANDSDVEGSPLTVVAVSNPANGTATIQGTTTVLYTPNTNFAGQDTFSYEIADNGNLRTRASVTITVKPINDPPTATDDTVALDEDTTKSINVLANDADPDNATLRVEIVQTATHGSLAINGDGSVLYTPVANFTGSDAFRYRIVDAAGLNDEASVAITVNPVNDAPDAVDDTISGNEDTSITIPVLANDKDIDNDALSIKSVSAPGNGAAAIQNNAVVYVPTANFSGQDRFTYVLTDGTREDTATVTVTVNPGNDAPEANDDSVNTNEDEAKIFNVLANDKDIEGDPLTVKIEEATKHGAVTVEANQEIKYTPQANYNGPDDFTYSITDPGGARDTAKVTINVNPVNDPPNATDDAASTQEDVSVTIRVVENDVDPDGDALSVTVVSGPQHGTVTRNGDNSFTYTPALDYSDPANPDTFTYQVSDGSLTDTATVQIQVASVNDPPNAADDTATTNEDASVTIDILSNDVDPENDRLTVSISAGPSNGSAAVNQDGSIAYTPNSNYSGPDSLRYQISDGVLSDEATVSITIHAVNDAPLAQDDQASATAGQPVSVSVLTNDSDPDSDTLTVTLAGAPANGAATVVGNTVVYTPNVGFGGNDQITYTISDGSAQSTATVAVSVTITGTNP